MEGANIININFANFVSILVMALAGLALYNIGHKAWAARRNTATSAVA